MSNRKNVRCTGEGNETVSLDDITVAIMPAFADYYRERHALLVHLVEGNLNAIQNMNQSPQHYDDAIPKLHLRETRILNATIMDRHFHVPTAPRVHGGTLGRNLHQTIVVDAESIHEFVHSDAAGCINAVADLLHDVSPAFTP